MIITPALHQLQATHMANGKALLAITRGNETRLETWADDHEAIARAAMLDARYLHNPTEFIKQLFAR